MLDILLIVVIGGMGTLYGAVVGSVLFVLAQNYLQDLLKLASSAVEGVPVLAAVLTDGPRCLELPLAGSGLSLFKGMDFAEALHWGRSARAAAFATSSGFDSRTASALMRAPQQQMPKPSLA